MPDIECPQCGCGTKDLVEDAWPVELRRIGEFCEMVCRICRHRWLLRKTQEVSDAR